MGTGGGGGGGRIQWTTGQPADEATPGLPDFTT